MIKMASIKHNEAEGTRVTLWFSKENSSIIGTFTWDNREIEEDADVVVDTLEEAVEAIKAMYGHPLWDLKWFC